MPLFELMSGAALAVAAFLLILPGFATDLIGILLVIPFTRRIILSRFVKKNNFKNKKENSKDYIEGDYEDISEDNDKKI